MQTVTCPRELSTVLEEVQHPRRFEKFSGIRSLVNAVKMRRFFKKQRSDGKTFCIAFRDGGYCLALLSADGNVQSIEPRRPVSIETVKILHARAYLDYLPFIREINTEESTMSPLGVHVLKSKWISV